MLKWLSYYANRSVLITLLTWHMDVPLCAKHFTGLNSTRIGLELFQSSNFYPCLFTFTLIMLSVFKSDFSWVRFLVNWLTVYMLWLPTVGKRGALLSVSCVNLLSASVGNWILNQMKLNFAKSQINIVSWPLVSKSDEPRQHIVGSVMETVSSINSWGPTDSTHVVAQLKLNYLILKCWKAQGITPP